MRVAIGERWREIQRRIEAACERCGRDPSSVTLVGASKRQPAENLLAAHRAGLSVFGENRVQEADAKHGFLPADVQWHLIGPLQSNKVRLAVQLFDVIHSVDRLKIARLLNREAARLARILPCLLEVNLGGEESKHGFTVEELTAAVVPLAELESLRIQGLMAIPPRASDPEASRGWFRQLRTLRDQLAERQPWSESPGWLSMGMSGDFEVAIEEGATHVRVGTALFGPRAAPETSGAVDQPRSGA